MVSSNRRRFLTAAGTLLAAPAIRLRWADALAGGKIRLGSRPAYSADQPVDLGSSRATRARSGRKWVSDGVAAPATLAASS